MLGTQLGSKSAAEQQKALPCGCACKSIVDTIHNAFTVVIVYCSTILAGTGVRRRMVRLQMGDIDNGVHLVRGGKPESVSHCRNLIGYFKGAVIFS
jgi:hypothetical protein